MPSWEFDRLEPTILRRAIVYAHGKVHEPGSEKWRCPPHDADLLALIREYYCRWNGHWEFPFETRWVLLQFVRFRKLTPDKKKEWVEILQMQPGGVFDPASEAAATGDGGPSDGGA